MAETVKRLSEIFDGVEIGIGAWAWGDRLNWGFGRGYGEEDIYAAFQSCVEAGVRFFDTAEMYGQGKSEQYLGRFIRESGAPVIVATKFAPLPWRLTRSALLRALRGSLKRLGMSSVDLYQVHFPAPPVKIETWMEAMVEAVHTGQTRTVGVSNFDRGQMQRAQDTLAREGVALASNQVEYHLLNRRVEKNGLIQQCQDSGVAVIAYSPIASGILSGKYTPDNPPEGIRSARYNARLLAQVQPLIKLMRKIGQEHGGKTPAQVAINWIICKGAIPIPGVKNPSQAAQNCGGAGWRLTEDEVDSLDEASDRVREATIPLKQG